MKRLAALAAVLLLAACSGGGGDLAKTDPDGAKACAALASAFEHKDDADAAVSDSMKAGELAGSAKTDAIRSAVIDLGGDKAADPEKMHDACVAAGIKMPEVPAS